MVRLKCAGLSQKSNLTATKPKVVVNPEEGIVFEKLQNQQKITNYYHNFNTAEVGGKLGKLAQRSLKFETVLSIVNPNCQKLPEEINYNHTKSIPIRPKKTDLNLYWNEVNLTF